MRSFPCAILSGVAAIALAGCNAPSQTRPVVDPVGPARSVALPEGSGCSAAIARYGAVMENDLKMGHVNQSVYAQVQGEIAEASKACAAGEDGRAVALIRASKARHGYPG
jgi:hypothetical protein